jgi:hypothetical protein
MREGGRWPPWIRCNLIGFLWKNQVLLVMCVVLVTIWVLYFSWVDFHPLLHDCRPGSLFSQLVCWPLAAGLLFGLIPDLQRASQWDPVSCFVFPALDLWVAKSRFFLFSFSTAPGLFFPCCCFLREGLWAALDYCSRRDLFSWFFLPLWLCEIHCQSKGFALVFLFFSSVRTGWLYCSHFSILIGVLFAGQNSSCSD